MSLFFLLPTGSGADSRVQLTGADLQDQSITPIDSEVAYRLTSGGNDQSYEGIGGSYATIAAWLLTGSNSDYEARLTVNSGTAPAGSANGSWLALSSTVAWTLTDTSSAGLAITNSCTIEIRDASTLDVLASATVDMSAEETA